MKSIRVLAILLVVLLISCAGDRVDSVMLAGEWVPKSAELGGQPFPLAAFAGANLNLTAGEYEFAGDKGTYKLMADQKPAQMDIHGVEGPNAGKDIKCIYKLDGDELTVCYQLGQGERPGAFESPEGTQIFLVHYKRNS